MSRLHIALVNFNSSRELLQCITSIPIGTYDSLVVVDNGSDRENVSLLEFADFGTRPIRCIYSSDNSGFGSAMNRAVEALGAREEDHIWLLNPDMVVNGDAILRLRNALFSREADIVSPVITTGVAAESIWYAGGDMDLKRGCTSHKKDDPYNRSELLSAVSFVTGAAPMMAFATWRKVGGFRTDLFLYWEDADLSLRATALGFRMAVVNHARVWHKVGASSGSSGKSLLWYYFMHRNRLIICGAYHSPLSLLIGKGATITLRLFVRAARERDMAVQKCFASIRGVKDGILASSRDV